MKLTTKNIMGEIGRLYASRPSTDVEACIIMNAVTKKILVHHYNEVNDVTISDIDRVFGMLIFVRPIQDDNMVIMPLRDYWWDKPVEGCGKCVIMGAAKVRECHEDHEGRERNAILRRIMETEQRMKYAYWTIALSIIGQILHVLIHHR